MRGGRRNALNIVLVALTILLSRPLVVFADPIQITSGFLSIGTPQGMLPGLVSSIFFSLSIDGFRLGGAEGGCSRSARGRCLHTDPAHSLVLFPHG
jgi:hypothetical protein